MHEFEIVGDLEADHFFASQSFRKFGFENLGLFFFHDEDEVSPADVTFVDADSGAGFCAS